MTANRTPFDDLPLPNQAGILCNDPQFQNLAGMRAIKSGVQLCPTAAAEFIRTVCNVTSRRDLATNPAAAERFAALRTNFDAWRGRLASPREGH